MKKLRPFALSPAIIITVLAGALTACGSDDDDDSPVNVITDTPGETSMPVDPDITSGDNAIGAPEGLNGSWFLSCRLDDGVYETVTLDIQNNITEVTISAFSDSACSIPEPLSPVTQTLSVVFAGITETALGPATNIDITVESVSIAGLESNDGIGDMFLDIILVMDDSLFIGETEDDETVGPDGIEPRPVELDLTDEFTRIP